jgi:hypothetical protein
MSSGALFRFHEGTGHAAVQQNLPTVCGMHSDPSGKRKLGAVETCSIRPRQEAERLLQLRDHTTIILTMGLPARGTSERARLEKLSEGGEVLVVVDSKKDPQTGTKYSSH